MTKPGFALGALLACAAPAFGQEAARERDVVVVTGEKTSRPLQETASSARIVSRNGIDDHGFDDIADIYRFTPNVIALDRSAAFAIRGIDVFGVSGGGNSFLASVTVDGAVMPQQGVAGGPLDLWDIDRVEILRGPQSTLQGRNALAGSVMIRSRDPDYDWSARGRASFTEYGGESLAFAAGGPLARGQAAFRVAAKSGRFDGFSRNPLTGQGNDFDRRDSVRGKLLVEPRALPGLRILGTLSWDEHVTGSPVTYAGRTGTARDIPFDTRTFEEVTTHIATLELEQRLSDAWRLTSVSSYNEVEYAHEIDADYSSAPLSVLVAAQTAQTFTQELRANFDTARANGVIGAYYYSWDEAQTYGGRSRLSFASLGVPQLLTAPPPVGLGLPQSLANAMLALYAPADPVLLDTTADDPDRTKSFALFADTRIALTDRLSLLAGGRLDHERQKASFTSSVAIANAGSLPSPTNPLFDPATAALVAGLNARLFAMAQQASGIAPETEAEFTAFLPKIGASWDWTQTLSTSVTIQRAFRTGGLGANVARSSAYAFDPEHAWNYELALRSQWLDGQLTVNANAFYLDWSDQQIQIQLSGNRYDTEIRNAGASHVYGFEAELAYAPVRTIEIFAGLGYARTRFDEFLEDINGVVTDLSGRPFPGAPRWTAVAGGIWRGPSGLFLSADGSYAGAAKAVVNPATFGRDPQIDARLLVNVTAGYETRAFGLHVFAENLLGDHYVASPDLGDGANILGRGRVIGLRLDAAL